MSDSLEQNRLFRAGSQPLEQVVDEVVNLAEAIWYQGYCPSKEELEQLSSAMPLEAFLRTLCVLEMVSQYPVCQADRAKYLQQLTRQFHDRLLGSDEVPRHGRYSPSSRWGLAEPTLQIRKALLPLQTRTHADATGYHHGLSA